MQPFPSAHPTAARALNIAMFALSLARFARRTPPQDATASLSHPWRAPPGTPSTLCSLAAERQHKSVRSCVWFVCTGAAMPLTPAGTVATVCSTLCCELN